MRDTQLKQPASSKKNISPTNLVNKPLAKGIIILLGWGSLWQLLVTLLAMPTYILPSPIAVLMKLHQRFDVLIYHSLITLQEILFGLVLGVTVGLVFALQLLLFSPLRHWLLPILVVSQAIPVFAIAPILMLWLGYGMASKIAMAAIIIFFPVTTCCYDGLRSTPTGFLDLAKTMSASKWRLIRYIRFPAALPAIASGIRVAVVVAPIGAIVGEWVGSSAGLGYLMLQANARMMIDEMFAALFILAFYAVTLFFTTDLLLKKIIHWQH